MLKTALIVDDSRLARLTLKRLLAKYDIEVAEAESDRRATISIVIGAVALLIALVAIVWQLLPSLGL